MQVRLPGRRTATIHAFPTTDAAFAADVGRALDAGRSLTADPEELRAALTAALHRRYPDARIVTQTELASLLPGSEVWYAYRDGSVRPPSDADEEASPV